MVKCEKFDSSMKFKVSLYSCWIIFVCFILFAAHQYDVKNLSYFTNYRMLTIIVLKQTLKKKNTKLSQAT